MTKATKAISNARHCTAACVTHTVESMCAITQYSGCRPFPLAPTSTPKPTRSTHHDEPPNKISLQEMQFVCLISLKDCPAQGM